MRPRDLSIRINANIETALEVLRQTKAAASGLDPEGWRIKHKSPANWLSVQRFLRVNNRESNGGKIQT